MSRRIVLSHVSVLLTAIAIPVLLPGCSRPSENPASTIKTMRFDPDESTVYQKAFPLSVDHLEELFKPPFLVDRTMSLWHVTAMVADDTTYFEKTLDSGSAIRERDANNNTLLHYSALNPNVEMTRFLLIPLANSYAKNDNDETPLDWAVTRNPNVEVVRLLYDTESGTDGFSPDRMYQLLRRAAEWNTSPDVLRFLFEQANETNVFNDRQLANVADCLLLLAANHNPNPEIIEILVEAGADPNIKSTFSGISPLANAASNTRNPAVLEKLIELGAEFGLKHPENRVRRNSYYTFFYAARDNPNVEISKWFIAQEFDPHLQDREKLSACDHAFRGNRNPEVVRFYLDLLEEKGIDDAIRKRLFAIAQNYNETLAHLLLDKYLDRDKVQGVAMSAFVPFHDFSRKPLWDRLLEYGADPHAENELGLTMVDVAQVCHDENLFQYLERFDIERQNNRKTRQVAYHPQRLPETDHAAWERVLHRVAVTDLRYGNVFDVRNSTYNYIRFYHVAATEQSREILRNAARPSLMYVPTNAFLIHLAELQTELGFYDDVVETVQKIKHAKLPPGKSAEDIRENGYDIIPDDNTMQQSEIFQRDMLLKNLVAWLLHDHQSQRAARAANMIFSNPTRDNALMGVLGAQCYIMHHPNYPDMYHEMGPKALQTVAYLSADYKNVAFWSLAKQAVQNRDVARLPFLLKQIAPDWLEDKLPSLANDLEYRFHYSELPETEKQKLKTMREIIVEFAATPESKEEIRRHDFGELNSPRKKTRRSSIDG